MSCLPCDTISCTYPIPECASTLNLGYDTNGYSTGVYKIYFEYFLGDEKIQNVQEYTLPDGEIDIIMDLTDPTNTFIHQNGRFLIWVTESDMLPQDKVSMTVGANTGSVFGVNFEKITGNTITAVDLVIV